MKTKKGLLFGIILTLLIVSIGVNIFAARAYLVKTHKVDITGTYCTNTEPGGTEKNDYVVLRMDGKTYDRYQQLGKVASGTYKLFEDGIYSFRGEGKKKGEGYLVLREKNLYVLQDDRIVKYEKISDTPSYINVKDNEKS